MSNKRTLADLMDNDFFIDFEDTKVKAERKSLTESLTRSKRTLKESINESEVESCYKRICASATEEKSRVIDHIEGAMIAVEVSKEHLKKALKLGAFGTYTGNKPHTVPAQYVESVDLEFMSNIQLETDYSLLSVQLHGEYNDENVIDYLGDVCNVQFREYQEFDTDEEALEFFEKEIRSNATKIAEEMIDEAWAECGCTDYEGITDFSGNNYEENDEDDDIEDGGTDGKGKTIKPDFSNWETLISTADMLLTGLTHNSGNDNYDDGDGYWVTEYTVWCQRYLYYTDELNNEAKLKTLCDEYSTKLPGVTFYYNIDEDEELCEIGYEASKQVDEGITDNKQGTPTLKEGFYKYEYNLTEDKISEEDLYKALVTDGELVSLNAGNTGEAVSFKDGGVYCDTTYEVTEYDGKFSVTEFHNSDDGECKEGDYNFETDSFETLCAELQKIFPNALIECKMTEEPDNAVVDCKVNKVIAHCEDEKPVDCLGKKKPLEKPLTEAIIDIDQFVNQLQKQIDDAKQYLDSKVTIEPGERNRVKIYFSVPEEKYRVQEAVRTAMHEIGYTGFKKGGWLFAFDKAENCWLLNTNLINGLVNSVPTTHRRVIPNIEKSTNPTYDPAMEMTGFEEDFKNGMTADELKEVELKEARSIEEIKAEIEKLQQELADAEAKEKRADYGRNLPTEVWIYDMYIDPANKGTWTSAELYNGKYDGYVYETADKAIRGGLAHLNELADEGELEGDPIDYTVEAINIPISEVDEDTLSFSNLDHLIEGLKESLSDVDSVRVMAWCNHNCVEFFEAVATKAPQTKQRKLNKEAYKAMEAKFGLTGTEAEDIMCKAYSLWKRLYK